MGEKTRIVMDVELDEWGKWATPTPMLGLRMKIQCKEDGVWIFVEKTKPDGSLEWSEGWNFPGCEYPVEASS